MFAGSRAVRRSTHWPKLESGEVGDLLLHTASPAPSLASSVGEFVTGVNDDARVDVPRVPRVVPRVPRVVPAPVAPRQHVTSFRPGFRM